MALRAAGASSAAAAKRGFMIEEFDAKHPEYMMGDRG